MIALVYLSYFPGSWLTSLMRLTKKHLQQPACQYESNVMCAPELFFFIIHHSTKNQNLPPLKVGYVSFIHNKLDITGSGTEDGKSKLAFRYFFKKIVETSSLS